MFKFINKLTRSNSSSSIDSNKQGTSKQPQKDIDDKILQKLKNKLNDQQYQLFVQSFYTYLNYNKNQDYIIDLDNIYQWIGYTRKDNAKKVLVENFKKDIDYKIIISAPEISGAGSRGQNKEQILMTVNIFKEYSMLAGTKKAREIYRYYINMEDAYFELICEEKEQSQQREVEYKKEKKSTEKYIEKLENKHKPYEDKPSDELLYIAQSTGSTDKRLKIGKTTKKSKNQRLKDLNTGNSYKFQYLCLFECMDGIQCENCTKTILWGYRRKGEFYEVELEFARYVCNTVCSLLDELTCCNDNVDLGWISNRLNQYNLNYCKQQDVDQGFSQNQQQNSEQSIQQSIQQNSQQTIQQNTQSTTQQSNDKNMQQTTQQNNQNISISEWAQNNLYHCQGNYILADTIMQRYIRDSKNQVKITTFSRELKNYLQQQYRDIVYGKIDRKKNKNNEVIRGTGFTNVDLLLNV